MPKVDELIAKLGPGWSPLGSSTPVEETKTIPNPEWSSPVPPPKGTPDTVTVGTGRYYVVVQDDSPEHHRRALFLTPSTDQGVQPPGVQPVPPITGKTPATGETVVGDVKSLNWEPADQLQDVPAGGSKTDITTPSETTWVDVSGPVQQGQTPQQQGHRIVNGQLVAIPGLTRAKPASDTSGAPQWIPDPSNPANEIQVVYSGSNAMPVTANGGVVSRPKKVDTSAVGGARWIPDPSNPANEVEVVTTLSPDGTPTNKPTGASRKAPATAPTAAGNVIWQDIPDQPGKQQGGTLVEGKFQPVEGLTKDKDKKAVAVYGTGANDKFRIAIDENGQVVSKEPNDNYVGEKPTQLTPDLVAPSIPLLKPDGSISWVENKNRVPANQAMYDLMDQLHVKVNDRSMSMADAKDLLTNTVNAMNATTAKQNADTAQTTAAASAANDVLSNVRGNATTGAGMLNQRVSSATGALNSMMSSMAGSNMQNLPAGTGAQLVRGLGSWVTGLGGGDATYDAAARMVQAADPKVSGDPNVAQQATQALQQMFQLYQQQNGKPAPQVAAALAAQQSQQQNAMVPPQTQPLAPQPVQPLPLIQPANVASGQMAPAGGTIPGQNYGPGIGYGVGAGGMMPWAGATPQPLPPGTPIPFMVPMTV